MKSSGEGGDFFIMIFSRKFEKTAFISATETNMFSRSYQREKEYNTRPKKQKIKTDSLLS